MNKNLHLLQKIILQMIHDFSNCLNHKFKILKQKQISIILEILRKINFSQIFWTNKSVITNKINNNKS
jgi:hypothetical protein